MADEKTMDIQDKAVEAEQPAEGEKKFTQADVDRIVKKRLHEERTRKDAEQPAEPTADQDDDAGAADEREALLNLRETKLDCREYIVERGYPARLLDILDTSDKEKFIQDADALRDMFEPYFREKVFHTNRRAAPLRDPEAGSLHDAVRRAVGGDDYKHTPKNKYFTGDD